MQEVNHPLVSLIAVCYNHKDYVEQSVLSMVNQTYKNAEIIIYDNDSNDGSKEILLNLQKKYKFSLFLQENIGLPRTLNIAINKAKGKYICLLSTDDFWPLEKTSSQVDFMESKGDIIAGCGGNHLIINEKGEVKKYQSFNPEHIINFKAIFLEGKNIPAASMMYCRSKLLEVGLYDPEHRIEDYYIMLKLTQKGYQLIYRNELSAYYRFHKSNFSHNYSFFDDMYKTLKLYSEENFYIEAKSNLTLRMFSRFSRIDRKYSLFYLKKLPFNIIFSKRFFKTLIIMLIPKKISTRITNTI